jgi:transcriptional regulator with XRE-family HTH domain
MRSTRAEVLARMPQAIAHRARELRTVLGLSQEEVARRAGVSQGAVSRVESGGCAMVSVHTVLGIFVALVGELAPLRERCTPGVRRMVEVVETILPLTQEGPSPILEDRAFEGLVRMYHELDGTERRHFVRIVTPLLELLTDRPVLGIGEVGRA